MSDTTSHHTITVGIAGYNVAIKTQDTQIAERLRDRYRAFLAPSATPTITIALKIIPGALYIEPQPGPWIIESTIGNGEIHYLSYTEKGHVDLASRHAVLEMAPDAHVENFLRVIIAWLCVENGSLLLHAAGVVRNGLGFIFFGPSGAGKTTTSRLAARSADVLSDDLVIIRREEDGYKLYGVPFKGELSDAPRANQVAPLKGVFRLRQDRQHFLEPISPMTAVAELVAASPFVNKEKQLAQQLISVCSNIARSVPVQMLHFRRDDGFWKVIDEYFRSVPATASADSR